MAKMRDLLTRKIELIKNEGKKKDQNIQVNQEAIQNYKVIQEFDNAKTQFDIRQEEMNIHKDNNNLKKISNLLDNKSMANKTGWLFLLTKILKRPKSNSRRICINLKISLVD